MSGTKLTPDKITSPFQLMAAWFSMLVLLVVVLLGAAANIDKPDWAAGFLVIFSSVVTLVVISCVTLMLTKFRPHLQDGKEYAQWLKVQARYTAGIRISEALPNTGLVPVPTILNAAPITADAHLTFQTQEHFTVSVLNGFNSKELVRALRKIGVSAEVYQEASNERDFDGQESIWLGERVSSKVASEVIKIASEFWPHLKYIHLSSDGDVPPDDVHDQIFLAGSSNTAMVLGLNPWSTSELSSLDGTLSLGDFHLMIRSKYR
ncbi:hypothetical protein PMI29_03014 [Pseudomonas sp. GM49]|uniref:hypothetical protein n=1 Tax=Pseudomonas sp. GM49 TaxID=1144331 RepID=UPI00026FD38E|nr:hypothetical protein [Pseudomonas sp. GM49]EJM64578.1 hypothetical protein PMI29_03014 [Pseudomonas sp. GM49]